MTASRMNQRLGFNSPSACSTTISRLLHGTKYSRMYEIWNLWKTAFKNFEAIWSACHSFWFWGVESYVKNFLGEPLDMLNVKYVVAKPRWDPVHTRDDRNVKIRQLSRVTKMARNIFIMKFQFHLVTFVKVAITFRILAWSSRQLPSSAEL